MKPHTVIILRTLLLLAAGTGAGMLGRRVFHTEPVESTTKVQTALPPEKMPPRLNATDKKRWRTAPEIRVPDSAEGLAAALGQLRAVKGTGKERERAWSRFMGSLLVLQPELAVEAFEQLPAAERKNLDSTVLASFAAQAPDRLLEPALTAASNSGLRMASFMEHCFGWIPDRMASHLLSKGIQPHQHCLNAMHRAFEGPGGPTKMEAVTAAIEKAPPSLSRDRLVRSLVEPMKGVEGSPAARLQSLLAGSALDPAGQ